MFALMDMVMWNRLLHLTITLGLSTVLKHLAIVDVRYLRARTNRFVILESSVDHSIIVCTLAFVLIEVIALRFILVVLGSIEPFLGVR